MSIASWLVAPQWTKQAASASCLAHQRPELSNQRDGQVPCERGVASEGRQIEALHRTERVDDDHRVPGDHACPPLGARQGGLEVEHPLHARTVGKSRIDFVPAEERPEQAHPQQSKNTVSRGPCRLTFHSSEPSGSLAANRVPRRRSSTSPRTRSAGFAGSSGKYIRVTSRFMSPRAKTDTARWGACRAAPDPGTDPGLMVVKWKQPSPSVAMRPKPRNAGSSGCGCVSSGCA